MYKIICLYKVKDTIMEHEFDNYETLSDTRNDFNILREKNEDVSGVLTIPGIHTRNSIEGRKKDGWYLKNNLCQQIICIVKE